MSILSKARDFFSVRTEHTALEVRGAFDPERILPQLERKANWRFVDDPVRLVDTVRKSVIVYACTTLLADAVAEATLKVYQRDRENERKELPNHPCRRLLMKPNPYMSGPALWVLTVTQMGIQGYGVIEKVRSGIGLPVELWPLRPDWLTMVSSYNTPNYWAYRVPGQAERRIPLDDLIIIPYRPDPRMERFGISPAIAAAREIGIDSALTDFLKTFLDAGGIPPFVLEHPDEIPDKALVDAMQEEWAQKYSGSKAYGKLPVLHGGYHIVPIGSNVNEMAWPDLRGLTELKICQAYRVPAGLVQAHKALNSGSLTTTEMDGDMAFLQRYGAAPLRSQIDDHLTIALLNEFTGGDEQFELGFDTSDVLALQEDKDKLHTRIRADYDAAGITLNQYLAETGRPQLGTEGDVYKLPFTTVFVPMSDLTAMGDTATQALAKPQLVAPALPAGKRELRKFDVKAATPQQLEVRAKSQARTNRDKGRLTQILDRQMRKFWKAQGGRVTAALKAKSAEYGDDNFIFRTKLRTKVAAAIEIDWDAEEEKLSEVLMRYYDSAGKTAFANVNDVLGVELNWTVTNPKIKDVVNLLAKSIVGINDETKANVQTVIADSLESGATIDEIADDLSNLFEETYKGRATTVARTETTEAYGRASVLGYQESGLVDQVELLDNPDHDTDPLPPTDTTCADRDGAQVDLGDANDYIASAHPNCILAVSPIVKSD